MIHIKGLYYFLSLLIGFSYACNYYICHCLIAFYTHQRRFCCQHIVVVKTFLAPSKTLQGSLISISNSEFHVRLNIPLLRYLLYAYSWSLKLSYCSLQLITGRQLLKIGERRRPQYNGQLKTPLPPFGLFSLLLVKIQQ